MAMENSDGSNHLMQGALSLGKEGLTSSDSGKEQKGAHDVVEDRKDEEQTSVQKQSGAADPEGDYLPVDGVNSSAQGFVDSETDSEDAVGGSATEDENGSEESYDSALERIAIASAGDPASPEVPSSPVFQPAETPQQSALRQLNLWNSGVPSLDSTLIKNVSPEEFRTFVAQIAQSQGLAPDSEDVEQVLSALLPLVDSEENSGLEEEAEVQSKDDDDVGFRNNNIGADVEEVGQEVLPKNMDDGQQNAEEGSMEVPSSHAEPKGFVAGDEPGKEDTQPLEPCHRKEENMPNVYKEVAEDITANDMIENQSAAKDANVEVEPEIIEWNDMNESDVDDVGDTNPPAAGKGTQKVKELGASDLPHSPQDMEVGNNSQRSSEEAKVESANLTGDNTQVDTSEEPSIGEYDAVQTPGQKKEGATVSGSVAQAGVDRDGSPVIAEEISGNAGMVDTGERELQKTRDVSSSSKSEVDAKLPVNAAREGVVKASPDLGMAESLYGPAESGEAEDLEGEISDGISINVGLQTDEEPLVAPNLKMVDDENLEHEVSEGQHDVANQEELPISKAATDSLERIGDSTPVVTGTSDAISTEDEKGRSEGVGSEKESNHPHSNVAKGEVSEKEKPTPVASNISTSSVNDSTPSLGAAGPSLPVRPAGLGRSMPSLEHAPRAVQRSSGGSASTRQASVLNEENQAGNDVSEGNEDAREKLQMIRVKFLRLAHRLGQSAHNVVVAQVLYRLGLAEQLRGGRGSGRAGAFSFERASVLAEEQEAAGADDLDFGCTIMVLGKSGVGKSATINSLFDEVKSGTNAYSPATNKVQEVVGTVHGIKLRVIDTPGLLTSFTDQRRNERIMSSVKRFIKKSPPDIVLYFDRLDMQSRDYSDLPLLRTITDTFGSAVWFNAIVVLTHASSAPPDGANGVPVSYEMFVAQRSHVVQQTIRQAAGDMRLMNPVSLVENHTACRRNRAGERVLPNGQVWKPQLLLLCFASKILAEANSLLKLQDNSPAKPFGVRSRVPPLPFLLSSLPQSRAQLKLPDEQVGTDDDESEDESDDEAESDGEEEYDDLPPFRRLTRDELKLLDKEQRRTYAEELDYREKLFMKKQLKEERARKKELKRRLAALPKEAVSYAEESFEEENASASSVPVPLPDMALPPSFDSDNPTYRYRYLDATNQWLVRPVLETHGWDHDSGYDGLNVEKMFVVSKKIPTSISGQVTKDKKEANLQMECAASFKNGEGKVTQAGLDIQTIGKDLAYTLRSETRFDNFKRNKTTCGLAVTLLGDTVAAGMKIEDRLLIGKRIKFVFNGGALTGRGDVAYGGSLEATVRDKDYPIGQFLSTFGLSVMDWHGDLAIGGNLQVQCKFGKTMTIVRGNLNNRRAGQVSVRVSSSEQLQMALVGLIPLLRTFINNRILSSN